LSRLCHHCPTPPFCCPLKGLRRALSCLSGLFVFLDSVSSCLRFFESLTNCHAGQVFQIFRELRRQDDHTAIPAPVWQLPSIDHVPHCAILLVLIAKELGHFRDEKNL